MSPHGRDELNEPHNLSKRQVLRVALICLVALAALLVGVVYAHAQPIVMDDPPPASMPLKAALGSYLTLSVIDAKQTGSCLIAGTCREANVLLKPFAGSPNGLVAVKLAANSATAYGIWKMRKKHPKAALGLAIAAAGLQVAVVAQNARVKR